MALAEAAWKRDTVPTERAAKLTVFTLWMTHLEIASPLRFIVAYCPNCRKCRLDLTDYRLVRVDSARTARCVEECACAPSRSDLDVA